jgi:hypothetical protein
MASIKINGEWRTQGASFVKIDGSWKRMSRSFVKINGVWRDSTFGSPPNKPTMTYVSTGVFAISQYDPTLFYEAIFKTGSGGTATLNTSNGRYTLSGANSGFDVVARYALNSLPSLPGYMERKSYRYSCRIVPQQCCGGCNCRLEGGNCFCAPPGPDGCPPGTTPNGQCGCGNTFPDLPCMGGSIGTVVCDTCCSDCSYQVCDVLIDEPGYINSGTEWYKVS